MQSVRETKRARALRWARRAAGALGAVGGVYLATLWCPRAFFGYERRGAAVRVYSDEPIGAGAAGVVARAEARLRGSPLWSEGRAYPVFVCNSGWRWRYFSGFDGRSRAFETFVGRAVFTRRARWERNALVGPAGDDGARGLDAYLAHEVTHMMVGDWAGVVAARRMPAWVREGYAEYVARSGAGEFDYEATRARLLAGEVRVGQGGRDPYEGYVLLVAHLLDREHWGVQRLLREPPRRDEVEARVRAGR